MIVLHEIHAHRVTLFCCILVRLPQPSGGRFNTSNSKNAVEWQIYLQSQVPGPKYYPKVSWDRGGTFSNATPLSTLDWEIMKSRGVCSMPHHAGNACFQTN